MNFPLPEGQALFAAPVIGVGFGWFLERGGLGNAPLLASQFYLKDLRVFKVMFSALLTAMLGAFWLDRVGLIHLGDILMPQTYLLPQAAGGVLFGFGFVVAGLCPGTSCVSAVSGRSDGIAVVAGIASGVALFDMAFPWLKPFYESTPMGAVTLSDISGVSHGLVVAIVTFLALAGFALAERIERRAA